MTLKNDKIIELSTGASASSKTWRREEMLWSALVTRLSIPERTPELHSDYMIYDKARQSQIKDIGGFVGAVFTSARRIVSDVDRRTLLTLDVDFAQEGFYSRFTGVCSCAAVVHSTHKSCPEKPRMRLIMPLSRPCSADEYGAVSRLMADKLGMEQFDPTTFDVNRVMFWPSVSMDMAYEFRVQDGEWLDVDGLLSEYEDWRDASSWPRAAEERADRPSYHYAGTMQEDPLLKEGLIGDFCRQYTIEDAIGMVGCYKPCGRDRYTYTGGTTVGGMVTFDHKFCRSWHAHDPAGGRLCNSYDLVRIHKFGGDEKAMISYVKNDPMVAVRSRNERLSEARRDFASDTTPAVVDQPKKDNWLKRLEMERGKIKGNEANMRLIFENDPVLKGLFALNTFDNMVYMRRSAPWRDVTGESVATNRDYYGAHCYIGETYGVSPRTVIDEYIELTALKNSWHPIRDYLDRVHGRWDGQKRICRLLHDYLGAELSEYTGDVMMKTLAGAVARAYEPGKKFDLILMLTGPQGIGKSTLVKKLGMDWTSDTVSIFTGKEAYEQLQGAWIVELAELAGMRKSEVETVKHFLSKPVDSFRPAYGRVTEVFPRQCVFIGTTNSTEFLKDTTGNRRFMVVECSKGGKNVFDMKQEEIDQIWGEAVDYYRKDGPLYMASQMAEIAGVYNEAHMEENPRKGLVERYLNKLLPYGWDRYSLAQRRNFYFDPLSPKGEVKRQRVSTVEVWVECFGNDISKFDRMAAREINETLRSIKGWGSTPKGIASMGPYGKQRYYERVDSGEGAGDSGQIGGGLVSEAEPAVGSGDSGQDVPVSGGKDNICRVEAPGRETQAATGGGSRAFEGSGVPGGGGIDPGASPGVCAGDMSSYSPRDTAFYNSAEMFDSIEI